MPLYRRLPKLVLQYFCKRIRHCFFGSFANCIDDGRNAKEDITCKILQAAGIASKAKDGVRLLGNGELKAKVTLKIAGATASSKAAVEKQGVC